jgi:hypothetical protein
MEMCMGIPEMRAPDRDLQNGRIARLEIEMDRLMKRMWLLGFAFTATALAVIFMAAALVTTVMAGR